MTTDLSRPPADGTTDTGRAWMPWAVTAAAAGAHVLVFLDKGLLGLVATPIRTEFGMSATTYGLISSATYLLTMVSCLAIALSGRRVSTRAVLLGCGALIALGQIPAALAGGALMLIASRVVVGTAEGPAVPLAHTAAYSWFPASRRGLPAAIITSGASFSKIALLPVISLLVVTLGWRIGFVAIGVVALVWLTVWYFLGRTGPHAGTDPTAPARSDRSWMRGLLTPTMLACLFATFAQGALAAVVFTWLPSYFQNALGFSAAASGTLFALPSVAGLGALFLIGGLGDRIMRRGAPARVGRGRVGGICLLASGLVLAAIPLLDAPVVAVAAVILGYGFSVTVNTVTFPVVSELFEAAHRAGALAMITVASAAAGVISPLIAGRLIDTGVAPGSGYTASFLVFGLVLALGGLVFALAVDPVRDRASA
ncbi:Predicted arabinose efflux permease, MFS family [Geodermatophilus telluris]|uniref:Predicted arabinose efflux permease, MFS family n=1 Tax=Geodermatophilus telluris TaxID=1190417 RepID=A0A1G6SXT0_9ACTN|nr:MFS transporter [Geodermatophilus telluris]SDD21682.1 Predicted arabinose efflux permease, MFS family [Geodermatophilus telluris]